MPRPGDLPGEGTQGHGRGGAGESGELPAWACPGAMRGARRVRQGWHRGGFGDSNAPFGMWMDLEAASSRAVWPQSP